MIQSLGIKARVLLLAMLPLAVISTALTWYFVASRLQDMDQAIEEQGLAVTRQLAQACEYGLFAGELEQLRALAQSMQADRAILSVRIADRDGRELVRVGPLRQWVSLHSTENRVVRSADALLINAPVWSQPVLLDDVALGKAEPRLIGYVSVGIALKPTQDRQRQMLMNSICLSLAVLVVAGLMALRLGQDIVRPIDRLTRAVRQIGEGDLNTRVDLQAGGEFTVLEQGIRAMTEDLRGFYDMLQSRIQEATAKLSWQATHDPLTGLVNRAEFEVRVERALADVKQQGGRHCLVFMDLDQFKVVNDTSGHKAGDELLRRLTAQLRQTLRNTDTLARMGGDEFGVLFLDCEVQVGLQLAEGLRRVVEAYRFHWDERIYAVGASLGLVELTAEWDQVSSLLSAADTACYAAKEIGRNRVHLYHPEDVELVRRRGEMEWASRISQAVHEGRLSLYCQYLHPLKEADATRHYEVLLRMVDHNQDIISPMAFLPAAERYQLSTMLDCWVVDEVLSSCAGLMEADPNIVLSINISGASLGDKGFQNHLRQRLADHPAMAPRLCLEITETAAIANLDTALGLIDELRKLGCRFALDDFGSGLSSFAYLRSLPVDYLKIDGAFVRDMDQDPIDASMVEAIHKVASLMGVRTVAEFVENAQAVEMLRQMGVDYAQGYYFHRPQPLQALCGEVATDKPLGRAQPAT